jgi:peptidoglycan hydrolase-like protein with peptidoglycan-binding domain
MPAIAKCESGFRQFDYDGSVLFDPSYSMIGVFQISSAHLPESIGLGMDIMTLDGNLAYARRLYTLNGIDPWMDSFGCWGSLVKGANQGSVLGTSTTQTSATPQTTTPTPATPAPVSTPIGLSLGMTSASILSLQQMLNKAGFVVAASGPGSPGQETNKFGSLTRDAVRRFQCAKGITCSGDESSTGYGLFDARTSQALTLALNPTPTTAQTTPTTPQSPTTSDPSQTTSMDKATQIAQVESQITALTNQLDTLNKRLNELTK